MSGLRLRYRVSGSGPAGACDPRTVTCQNCRLGSKSATSSHVQLLQRETMEGPHHHNSFPGAPSTRARSAGIHNASKANVLDYILLGGVYRARCNKRLQPQGVSALRHTFHPLQVHILANGARVTVHGRWRGSIGIAPCVRSNRNTWVARRTRATEPGRWPRCSHRGHFCGENEEREQPPRGRCTKSEGKSDEIWERCVPPRALWV